MSDKEFDLLAMGEVLLRLSPPEYERICRGDVFQKQVGGAELNVVSGVSLMGLRTGLISRIPDTPIGRYAKNKLRFLGVSDDYLLYDYEIDARLGVYYYENGAYPRKPDVLYDRGHSSMKSFCIKDVGEQVYEATRCFHTSGITLALSPSCREAGMEIIREMKKQGTLISFDVNYRSNLWSGEEARTCIEQILPEVDVFFCSEDTARLTFGKTGDLHGMMKSFADEYDISVVASTRRIVHSPKVHSFSSLIYHHETDSYYEEKPYEHIEVVDRIGSGDAYVAGVLYGLLSSDMDCRRALQFGNACSAAKNTIPGDLPSLTKCEIEEIIAEHQNDGYKTEMKR